jgi:hypothetical protein
MKNCLVACVAALALAVGASRLLAQEPEAGAAKAPSNPADVYAELYEHLANSIIEIRATEDNLVKGLLIHYHAAAQRSLMQAGQNAGDRAARLETAAANVANIANEGDKRVQAVRQRLKEAGHYHQSDAETQEDYVFINSAEKKSLLSLAEKIGRLGSDANTPDIRKAAEELRAVFNKAVGRE